MHDYTKELLNDVEPELPRPRKEKLSPVDHWTPSVLLERAAYLRQMAKAGNGSAGETLKEYPHHAGMLSFRSRDGEAEVHENFADLFYVLSGRAVLMTGGTVVGPRIVAPGETRGDRVEGGERHELRPGDLAHVPAGEPHQMLVSSEETVTCFVLKIEEKQ